MIQAILLQVVVGVVLSCLFTTQSVIPSLQMDHTTNRNFVQEQDFEFVGSDFEMKTMNNETSLEMAWLVSEYERLLEEFPLVTKSVTAAFVSFIGDVIAQSLIGDTGGPQIDWERVASVSAEGLFVSGPLLHIAYDWMDRHVSDEEIVNSMLHSFLQVFLDIFVMDSVFAMTLMVVSALLQRRSYKQIYNEIKSESLSAIGAAWASSLLLSPLQFCNFQFVPVQYRVLITNVQDVLWNAAVSYTAHRHRNLVTKEKVE